MGGERRRRAARMTRVGGSTAAGGTIARVVVLPGLRAERSAETSAAQLEYRSDGSLASAVTKTTSTAWGTVALCPLAGGTGS
jgi:hypothetical protein